MDPFTALWRKLRGMDAIGEDQKDVEYRVHLAELPYQNVPDYPQSTFIKNIRYSPRNKRVFVRIGSGEYWYPMTEFQLSRWMHSPSLGQWYNKHLKLK